MAIARLTETLGAANSVAGNYDVAVAAPAATPSAVCVIIVNSSSATDVVTSATYGITTGAVPLIERRFVTEATEPGAVWLYWASGVVYPAGAQTVRIVRTGTDNLRAAVCPMTVAAGQQASVDVDTTGTSASVANPSWAMTTLTAATVCYEGIHSGLQTMTTTPATNWTSIGTAEDVGNVGRGWAFRVMASAANALPGWIAATADDFVGASIAFKEAPLTAPIPNVAQLMAPMVPG